MESQKATKSANGRVKSAIQDRLRRMITTLELPPGKIVSESYLISLLNCGRTPLRDALLLLAHDHLITLIPGVGMSIAPLSITDFTPVSEMCAILYGASARLAAERISEAELAKLEDMVDRSVTALERGDVTALCDLDLEFHEGIAEAADNQLLLETIKRCDMLSIRFTHYAYERNNKFKESWTEHRALLHALRDRDPEEAARQGTKHIRESWERVREAL